MVSFCINVYAIVTNPFYAVVQKPLKICNREKQKTLNLSSFVISCFSIIKLMSKNILILSMVNFTPLLT